MSTQSNFPARSFGFFVLLVVIGLAVAWSTRKENPAEPVITPGATAPTTEVVYSRTIGSAPTPYATIVTYKDEGLIIFNTKNLSTNRFTRTVEERLVETDQTSFRALLARANPLSFKSSYRCESCPVDLPTERLTFYLPAGNKTIELYQPDEVDLPLDLAAILEQMKMWETELAASE